VYVDKHILVGNQQIATSLMCYCWDCMVIWHCGDVWNQRTTHVAWL